MRRTYRSKKEVTGTLDHRDVLQNMDEKSSAFDAFYIQNIKQTKREISCFGSSNPLGTASNKVRKRKYVRRIVKDPEILKQRESTSPVGFLTPDKSFRVNKPLDPFDLLLNSSPACQVAKEHVKVDISQPKKAGKIYTRKKRNNIKKINYSSSDSSDSGKENSSSQFNITDIKSHELVVERDPSNSSKHFDESINKIVNNLFLLSKINQKSNNTFNASFKHKMRMSKINSPILQKSPLCSTPFKEKYRGKSIYAFSPISIKRQSNSPNYVTITEENNDSNNSILFVTTNTIPQLLNESNGPASSEKVPNVDENNDKIEEDEDNIVELQKSEDIFNEEIDIVLQKNIPSAQLNASMENKFKSSIDDSLTDKDTNTMIGNSPKPSKNKDKSLNITEVTPFLVFSEIIEEGTDKNTPEKTDKASTIEPTLQTTEAELFLGFSKVNESLIKDKEYLLEHLEEVGNDSSNIERSEDDNTIQTENNCDSSYRPDDSVSSSHDISEKESMYDTCSDMSSNEINIQNEVIKEPIVQIERMDNELIMKYYSKMHFDFKYPTNSTCASENDNVSNISDPNTKSKEENDNDDSNSYKRDNTPNHSDSDDLSNISEIDDDTFRYKNKKTSNITYNDNSVISENDNVSHISYPGITLVPDISENDDLDSTQNMNMSYISNNSNVTHDNNTSYSSIATDSNEIEPKSRITINDSDDVTSNDDDESEESAGISFITTRRGNDFTKNSMFMFNNENSFVSNSADCDKTVLSNKVHSTRQSMNLNETKEGLETETEPNNFKHEILAGSNNDITLRKSRFIRQNNAHSYEESDMTLTEKDTEENTEVIKNGYIQTQEEIDSTRKASTSFRASNFSCMDSSRIEVKPSIVLHPGKKWERSLSIFRRMSMMTDHFDSSFLEDEDMQLKGRNYRQSVINTMEMQDSLHNESITSRRSTFVSKPSRPTIRFVKDTNGIDSRVSLNSSTVFDDLKGFLNEECDDTVIELSKLSLADSQHEVTVLEPFHESERVTTAKDYVLRRCNQTEPLLFDECYPETVLKNCHKIGEGVYGEVFLWRARDGRARVMKIVPIAGHVKVNGEQQKDFHEIISEIVIAMELSALRAPIAEIDRHFEDGKHIDEIELHAVENATDVFNEVLAVRCVYGPYPSRLLDLWELYDECKGSDNDNPAALPIEQQYIVLELANAGQDLESFQFTSAQQAHALFQQIAFGLAVGEEACQFEHRDLHWGNVLIAPTEQKYATFVLRNRVHRVPRGGVAATIIDYSLSRVSLALAGDRATAALYNDLATDEALFDAVGDYQFEVYRLMRDKLGNEWKNFEPYTNILWLHYTVDKMITALRYKRTNTKIHKHYIEKLKGIKDRILTYGSATDYVLTDNEI